MEKEKKYIIIPILISLCAVLLSQIKPLYMYFERPEIDILVGKSVNFYEGWGNLGANIFVQLINTGDAGGTVEKIEVLITSKETDYAQIMRAQSYYLQPESIGQNEIVAQIPFSFVTVDANSIWSGFINAYSDFSKSKQKQIQDFIQSVDDDLNRKWRVNPEATIEDELLNQIIKFTRKNLKEFDIGEHRLLILVWMQGEPDPRIKKGYSFTVYDSDKTRLYRKEQEYPFGGGIILPLPQALQQQMSFNSVLTEIKDKTIINNLYKAYQKELL